MIVVTSGALGGSIRSLYRCFTPREKRHLLQRDGDIHVLDIDLWREAQAGRREVQQAADACVDQPLRNVLRDATRHRDDSDRRRALAQHGLDVRGVTAGKALDDSADFLRGDVKQGVHAELRVSRTKVVQHGPAKAAGADEHDPAVL